MSKIEFARSGETPIEGYLSDEEKCRVLIILREPDNPDEVADRFWFYEQLNGKASRAGTRYTNVLGKIVGTILKENVFSREEKISLLKQCGYININPYRGAKERSKLFYEVVNHLKCDGEACSIDSNSNAEQIAKNRMAVIASLAKEKNCTAILTVGDVFEYLCVKCEDDPWMSYKEKTFRKGVAKGNVPIYEIYHPSYLISYDKLDAALKEADISLKY